MERYHIQAADYKLPLKDIGEKYGFTPEDIRAAVDEYLAGVRKE